MIVRFLASIVIFLTLALLLRSFVDFLNRPPGRVIDDKPILTISDAPGPVTGVSYSPDGSLLAYSTFAGKVHLWNVAEKRGVSTLAPPAATNPLPPLYSAVFSPDGKTLAAGSADGSIYIWSVPGGRLLRTLVGHTGPVWSVQISSSGKWLISGSRDGTIRIWDLANGTLKTWIDGEMGWINSARLSPDETRLAAAGEHYALRQWLMNKIDEQDPEAASKGIYFAYDLAGISRPTFTPTSGPRERRLRGARHKHDPLQWALPGWAGR
jgi:WD40 repeat protein